ncbi:glycoside hydrolase family 76 protein [Legionella feeleii]|uniref:Glycosyl hydrolase family 76 n=1 Tax=Legionella feeleii TaxID=453 RepID=A0A0W0THV8_9GAMM|nr:glycoside hydrolase family 76 protein [Legionella feeleii]KTC94789.1 Glycosyl hydrolase family 76 [Legionella feeleii]SPX60416.1 Predicted glycosyl hydrolase [Legionella feeleii]
MLKIITTSLLSLVLLPFSQSLPAAALPSSPAVTLPSANQQNNEFRDAVIQYVRSIAASKLFNTTLPNAQILDKRWDTQYAHRYWYVSVIAYFQGQQLGVGTANEASLSKTIAKATERALEQSRLKPIGTKELAAFRFQVIFDYPPRRYYSFIEDKGKGLELQSNRVVIRYLDGDLIKQQIYSSQHYLLNNMHPQLHGFYKKYDVAEDNRGSKLHTIYSASSLYTLLKIYRLNKDPQLEKHFKAIAAFLLGMQVTQGKQAGSFYYSYDINTKEKTCFLSVGTTSKTIFTLLELYRFYHEEAYLSAAKRAGDWLLTMIMDNGQVISGVRCKGDNWRFNKKQSFLYSGQVLSALSRLYLITNDQRYYDAATKIAQYMTIAANKQGDFVGDDFRAPNTISTSWVLMALIDYSKINNDSLYREVIDKTASAILARQIYDPNDAYNHGRYLDTMATSGNGWINEVMGELHQFCLNQGLSNCKQYRDAIILTTRWLLQNAYTEANSYDIRNPSQAIGGFMRDFISQSIRTDAVCHGVNSLITLLTIIDQQNQRLVTLAEKPFNETIGLLRIGKVP